MTILLLRRYLTEPRLIWTAVMVASVFAMGGDMGLLAAFLSTILTSVVHPHRASLFEAALPLSARTILRARLLATYVFSLTPIVVWFIAMRVSRYAQLSRDLIPDMVGSPPLTDSHRVGLVAILLVSATIPLMISSRSIGQPTALQLLAAYATLFAGSAGVFFSLPAQTAATVLMMISIAAVVWTLRNAPESFHVADDVLPEERASSRPLYGSSAPGNRWVVTLVQSMLTWQWFIFALLFILQASLGSWMGLIGIPFVQMAALRRKSAWTSSLPISHRSRLMMTFAPVMAGTFGSIVLGQFVHVPGLNYNSFNPISWQSVHTPYDTGKYFSSETSIKLMYWEIAPNGVAPVITSPSGERVEAYTLRLPGLVLYNPYSSNERSSKDFIAWQYARASTRVYGHPVPVPQTYEEGLVFPRPLYAAPRVQILNGAAVLCFMLLLYLAAQTGSYRAPAGKGLVQRIGEALPITPGILCISIDAFYGTSHGTQIIIPLAKRLLLNLSDALPSNVLVVLLVAVVPVAMLYALIEWQFARTEHVPIAVVKQS